MKKAAAAAIGLGLVALLGVSLAGDVPERPKPLVREEVSEPVDDAADELIGASSETMAAATEEVQFMLRVLSNAVPVSQWTPEQPVAELVERPSCPTSANESWSINWSGVADDSRAVFDEGIRNTFANSYYELSELETGDYGISGESGFEATARFNEAGESVELTLISACFEDLEVLPAD